MTVFFSIVTLFLSLAVVIIAALQLLVADNKMRLDLFERRYKVYDATRKFLDSVLREIKFTDTELFEFDAATSDAGFLFGIEIVDQLAAIRERAVHLREAQRNVEQLPAGEQQDWQKHEVNDDCVSLDVELRDGISKTFAPYLEFANVRVRFGPSLHVRRMMLMMLEHKERQRKIRREAALRPRENRR